MHNYWKLIWSLILMLIVWYFVFWQRCFRCHNYLATSYAQLSVFSNCFSHSVLSNCASLPIPHLCSTCSWMEFAAEEQSVRWFAQECKKFFLFITIFTYWLTNLFEIALISHDVAALSRVRDFSQPKGICSKWFGFTANKFGYRRKRRRRITSWRCFRGERSLSSSCAVSSHHRIELVNPCKTASFSLLRSSLSVTFHHYWCNIPQLATTSVLSITLIDAIYYCLS